MRKLVAIILTSLGVLALVVGGLGATVWAPEQEHRASVVLPDPGEALVFEPGVLYVGGESGSVTVEGEGEILMIAATPTDAYSYLDGVRYTVITGVPTWQRLATQEVAGESEEALGDVSTSDLWRSVERFDGAGVIDIAAWRAQETTPEEQPYRALMVVNTGENPALNVTMTWPSNIEHGWVAYAYVLGTLSAIIGLTLLLFGANANSTGGEGFWDLGDMGGEGD